MSKITNKAIKESFNNANIKAVEDVKQTLLTLLPNCTDKQYNLLYQQYFMAYESVSGTHRNMAGKLYKGREAMSAEQFADLVKKTLDKCNGVYLTQDGQKLQARGNTKPNCKTLKAMGYKWNGDELAWEWFTVSASYVNANIGKALA